MKTLLRSLLLTVCLLTALPAQAQTRYYVDANATGNNNGSSWTHALKRLQNAFNNAGPGDEIWVAAGTYYPDQGPNQTNNDPTESFVLKPGVKFYGGFNGTEATLGERDVAANPTILSGVLDVLYNIHAYHVVRGGSADASTVLDGFTITGGKANGTGSQQSGGGLFIKNSSPTLQNLTITGNTADNDGAGLFFDGSSSVLTQSTIEGNTASRNGGGIYLLGSGPTIRGTTITDNTASDNGGGVYIDSGSGFNLIGSTISDNSASGLGGGLYNQSNSVEVRSTILWGNTHSGGNLAAAQVHNNLGTANVSFSITQGGLSTGSSGSSNLADDPLLGALANNGGPTQTQLLAGHSPAIDAGSCYGQLEDQRGKMRPYDADDMRFPDANDGCDVGAVEMQTDEVSSFIFFVDADATGMDDGTSWENAFPTLQSALAASISGFQIWIAEGTYYPDEGTGQTDDDRTSTFRLKNGVALYGGFAGTEMLLEERDVAANASVLNGNIDKNSGNGGNAHHVVTAAGVGTTAILDGFTIRGGNANIAHTADNGGGVYVKSGTPILANNTITDNRAEYGGGVYVQSGSPTLMDNIIMDNTTTRQGGGIYIEGGSPTLTDNTILSNTAQVGGGGIYIEKGSPALTGNLIDQNTGVYGGGIYIRNGSATLTSNTITKNTASLDGGGIYIYEGDNTTLIDNTLSSNTAPGTSTGGGGGIFILRGSPTLTGNILSGNTTARSGGGIYMAYSGRAALTSNTLSGNTASGSSTGQGGGIYIQQGSPTLMSNTISGNRALGSYSSNGGGGGLYLGGGSLTLMSNTVSGNTTDSSGGGLHIRGSGSTLTSNTIIDNHATGTGDGGGIFNRSNNLEIHSTILWGNTSNGNSGHAEQLYNSSSSAASVTVSFSIVQESGGSGADWENGLGTDGGGNLDAPPMLGPLQNNGGPTKTKLPAPESPAIDAGSCLSGTITMDQRGLTRPHDANDNVFPNADDGCDIGAVELQANEVFAPVCNGLCYVNAQATGASDGNSWEDAFTSLQDALFWSLSGDALWVASGTYYPDEGTGQSNNTRASTFRLKAGVAIYGGFAGTETLLEERDVAANASVLNGNIDKNSGNGGNAHHVVTAAGVGTTAILDGFTITKGNANGSNDAAKGGGLYLNGGSPMLTGNTIIDNRAKYGAGLHTDGGNPTLAGNTIMDNTATNQGGGLYVGTGSPTLTSNTITGNHVTNSGKGGGIYNSSSNTLVLLG